MNILQWRVAQWRADVALCWDRLLECILGPSPAKMLREAMIGGLEQGLREWAEEERQLAEDERKESDDRAART